MTLSAQRDTGKPGNVILITADQWRADFCCGDRFGAEIAPSVDALARDATVFTHHFANTTPCGPSRACLFTGMYAHNHRSVLNGTPLDGSFTNLALEARARGYRPALFGYTDTSMDPRHFPSGDPSLTSYEGVLPGLDEICGLHEDGGSWLSYLEANGIDVPGPGYQVYRPASARDHALPTREPARFPAEHSETAWLVDRCIDHLQRTTVTDDQAFFVHLSLLRPHPPWIAPEPYNSLFDPGDMPPARRRPSKQDEAAGHPFLDWQLSRIRQSTFFMDGAGLAADLDNRAVAAIRATYAGLVREVSDNLARLFGALRDLGVYDDTLIVLTSDHGEQLGDHFLFGKLGFFDESYRIPLIIRDPRNHRGRGLTIDAFTESIDIMPTILNWIGQRVPGQCDGRSLSPWLRGEQPAEWRNAVNWSFDFRSPSTREAEHRFGLPSDACGAAVRRDKSSKYVHFAGLPPLLFDLESDCDEMVDLSTDPGYQAKRLHDAEAMLSWRQQTGYGALANTLLTEDGPVECRRN